jgi:hypothetical protein
MSKLPLILLSATLCLAGRAQERPDTPSSIVSPEDSLSSRLGFSVNFRNGEAFLNWTSGRMLNGDFFIVEKSIDSLHFDILSAIGAATDSSYSISDNSVGESTVYYRLRITGSSGNQGWTGIVSTRAETPVSLRFYPNPVDKQLILRATHTLGIQVRDAYGTVWINREIAPGTQIINVSTLQKGTYILQATDKQTNRVISEQLIKG